MGFKRKYLARKFRAIFEIMRTKRFLVVGIRPENGYIKGFSVGCMPKWVSGTFDDAMDDVMTELNRKLAEPE